MTQRMQDLAAEIVRLQTELDREIEARRRALGVRLRGAIGEFEHGIVDEHRKLRMGMAAYFGVPIEALPEGAFKASGTMVRTVVATIPTEH